MSYFLKFYSDFLHLLLPMNASVIKIEENTDVVKITDFIRVINTNVVWNYCICEQAVRRMKEKGGGSIVFINLWRWILVNTVCALMRCFPEREI